MSIGNDLLQAMEFKHAQRICKLEDEIASLKAQLVERDKEIECLDITSQEDFRVMRDDNTRLRAQLDEAMRGLERVMDDAWYRNAYVPADNESVRSLILIDRINDVRKIARECLEKLRALG
jgi:hypothetical protein